MEMLKSKDLYSKRKFFQFLLLICASTIVLISLAFTYYLARTIEKDEKTKINEVAEAYQILADSKEEADIEEALKIIQNNHKIPVIWVNADGEVQDSKNFNNKEILGNSITLKNYLIHLKRRGQIIEFSVSSDEANQLLYYDASSLLKLVKIYPYFLLALVSIFLVIALVAVSFSRSSAQNQLWAGMAKETAHQLGTPLSSLSAWIEYLESRLEKTEDEFIIEELKKDVSRLELVADRFSKIGSKPALQAQNVLDAIHNTVNYMSKRAAKSVRFNIKDNTKGDNQVMLNLSLFEWVIENMIKNALDAMEGLGQIDFIVETSNGVVTIDIKDSGKGIPQSKIKSIFEPGFSTKKRGWGLGLSLSKRIIEQYHNGKLFVKESGTGKGTTFRIEFRKDIVQKTR